MNSERKRSDFLSRQYQFLIDTGVSDARAVEALGAHATPQEVKHAADYVHLDERDNLILSALYKHSESIGLSQGGVRSEYGQLLVSLTRLRHSAATGMRGIPFYLAGISLVAWVVVTVLMVFVIPQFEEIFKEFGADLPALTVLVISLSKLSPFFLLVALMMVVWITLESIGFRRIVRKGAIPKWYSWKYFALGRVARQYFDVIHVWLVDLAIRSKRSQSDSLEIAARVLRDISDKLVLDGSDESTLFNELIASSKIGTLERELAFRSEYLLVELPAFTEARMHKITFLVQIAIGIIVGIFVIAMYLPIFKLGAII